MSSVSVSRRAGPPQPGQPPRPGRVAVERVAGRLEVDVLGQHHRQLFARHRHRAARLAMDDRDRRPPVTLARHAPVAQPPDGRSLAPAVRLGAGDHLADGVLRGEAVEEAAVHQPAGARISLVADRLGRLLGRRRRRRG